MGREFGCAKFGLWVCGWREPLPGCMGVKMGVGRVYEGGTVYLAPFFPGVFHCSIIDGLILPSVYVHSVFRDILA